MEKTITIKFSTGKEIQLTESEYEELKQEFTQRRGMEIPRHPIHHQYFPDYYETGRRLRWVNLMRRYSIC